MSEPRRLRDDAPDEMRALLRAASGSRAMSDAEKDRSRARLARTAAAAAVAGGVSWFSGAAFGAGVGVVIGVASLLAPPTWFGADPPATPALPASVNVRPTAPLTPPPKAEPAAPEPPPAEVPRPTQGLSGAPSAQSAAPAPSVDALAEEAALLDRARGALVSPAEALRLTGEHAARFPRGKMGIEREMIAIEALRRLGRGAESRARAESLLARAKGSLYEDRLREMLNTP